MDTETNDLAALQAKIGHCFREVGLLERALTHPSYAHEHPPARHNETLAFLGDAVLGLVVAELLQVRAPDDGPGLLTPRRAELVSAKNLADWAARLDVSAHLRLGRGEGRGGGRGKESVLASALEAVIAAVYLDGGLAPAQALIARLMDAAPPAQGSDGPEAGGAGGRGRREQMDDMLR